MLTTKAVNCLGLVLAGGLSSRMGQDKAFLKRNQSDMLSFSKQLLLDSGVDDVVVSGNGHQIPDLIANAGPVVGIYSVLKRFPAKALMIIPVDLPLMNASALEQLRIVGELKQQACFFKDNNIPLYLPNNAFLELFLAQTFTQFNGEKGQKKGPSFSALLNQVPHQAITPKSNDLLFNTNTPEQWQQAKIKFA